MTLRMLLRWKNPDASTDINLRLKDVAVKGFMPFQPTVPFVASAPGAEITPVPFVLQVTVTPFVLINYDGAVVTSDTVSAPITVADGQINYIVCRARYRLMDSPILQMQPMTQAAYLADPELPWLHVVGVVDLSVGGPYTSVPLNRIFYEARDAVDQQTRSSWREPVATTADLPPIVPSTPHHNRNGDVRLVTSTGSLYWWNEGSSLWEVFDEVPLITHRDYEHTNGITGDSAAGTLLPGVSGAGAGSNLTIAAVPVGSAYTLDGRLLQTPGAPTTILASSVGALRGLVRVEATPPLGTLVASYRASSGTNNVNYARIVNMSDDHPAGLFSLSFTTIDGALSWDSGLAVVVPVAPSGTRRYRLYRPNGVDWIEIAVLNTPAAPGLNISDTYTVNAPTDFETNALIGYWFWDGSGTLPLIVGEDKRRFGNLAFPQMGTEFKEEQFYPPMTELRGDMVYSGGTCSALVGLNLRITGPIVSYIAGKRFETPAFYTGTAFPASSTRFVYVDDQGVLQIQVTDPATVFDANGRPIRFAEVARIVTDGVGFTTIEDRRDPQIIVGNATRDSRVRFTGTASARWNEANTRLVVENNGTTTGVEVETGRLRITENLIEATTGALAFDDTNTPSPQALTAAGEGDLAVLQPGNSTPSVFGTMRDLQRAKKFAVGVETGCVPSIGAGTTVDIAAGTFYDALGRRISFTGTTNVAVSAPLANNVYAIVWDPDLTVSGSFKSVNLTANSGCEILDLPFAVVVLNGAANAITLLENVVRFADGQYDRSFVTISGTAAFDEANFNTLRKAMLHIMCFATTEPAPKEVRVVGNLTEPNTAAEGASIRLTSATGFPWAQPSRFSGLKVVGKSNINAAPGARPVITWTSTTGPLIDFNATSSDVRGFGFQGVNFSASGAASVTDHNRVLFKNLSRGFSCTDATIDGNNILSHFVYWTDSVVELGGGVGAASQSAGVLFQRVFGTQCVDSGGDAIFFFGDNTGIGAAQVTDINGRLTVLDCVFECDNTDIADYFIWTDTEVDTDTGEFDIVLDKTTLSRFQRVFNNCDEAQKLITASTLSNISIGISLGATRQAQITGTVFAGTSVLLTGAGDIVGCSLASTCTLTIATTNRITSCDFSLGTVTGSLGSISNSVVNLGITGLLSASVPSSGVWPSITNSTILKANDNANSNTMLSLTTSGGRCIVTATQFSYTNTAITATTPMISMSASGEARLVMKGCTLNNPNGFRNSMTNAIVVTSTGDFRLMLDDCVTDMPLGFLQVLRGSGTSGEVAITNCLVATDGQNALDISTSGTGYMASVSISDSKFTCTATDPIYNIFHAKDLFVTNNVFNHTNGAAAYTFGGTTATEGRQDVALIKGNSFKGTTNGGQCNVYGDSYTKFMYDGNSQAVINVTNLSTTYLLIGGQAFSRECTVANNQLTCDSNSVSGDFSSALVLVNSFAEIAVTGNSLYSGALGATLSSEMLLTAGRAVTCTGNTLLSTQNVAGTVENCYVAISAQCAAAGEGNITVSSNAMEASVGGSGSGFAECVINVNSAFAAVVSGNAIRTRQNGTGAIGHITVGSGGAISYVDVSNNILRSSQDAAVDLLSATTSMTFSGNLLDANAGTAIVDLAQAATTVNATGNTLFSSGNGQLVLGTTATEEAIATGNVLSSNSAGSILSVVSNRMASATGNAVRSGASVVVVVGATSTVNGLASNNILEATTNIVLDVDGTFTASATGNTLRSSDVATMTVGSSAAGTNNAVASNNSLEGNDGVNLTALGDAAVNVVGNIGRSSLSTVIMRADGITSNYVGCLANNTIRCLSGTATLSCGADPLDTGLMCSISDNVVRSSGQAVIIMSGTHIFSKFRDNVASGGFNVGAIGVGVLSGGNNVA